MQTDRLHSSGFPKRIEKHSDNFHCHIVLTQGILAKHLLYYCHHDHSFSTKHPLSHLKAFNKWHRFKIEPQHTNEKQRGFSKKGLNQSYCFPLNCLYDLYFTGLLPAGGHTATKSSSSNKVTVTHPQKNQEKFSFQQPSEAREELASEDVHGHAGSVTASDQRSQTAAQLQAALNADMKQKSVNRG